MQMPCKATGEFLLLIEHTISSAFPAQVLLDVSFVELDNLLVEQREVTREDYAGRENERH
jgi:hypothetical protein